MQIVSAYIPSFVGSLLCTCKECFLSKCLFCAQIDHKYEERRLLVALSCGELGQLVGSEMRTSLILSIVHQLVDDQASIVREAAAHNLAMLLPLFTNMDKYSKVSLAKGPIYGAAF